MLLRWPKRMGMNHQRGKKLSQPVELRDVLPTFLDAAGAPIPNHLDGKSMLELVRGNTKNWRQFIDLEHSMCYNRDHWTALTDGRFKYVWRPHDGVERLFDLDSDPREEQDLVADAAQRDLLERWRGRLVQRLADRPEGFSDGKRLITDRPYPPLQGAGPR